MPSSSDALPPIVAALPPSAGGSGHTSPMRAAYELLSSMRFAIALLSVLGIASVIGTVIRQGEPLNNYINQFGPFWAELLGALGLFNVYSAPWFLLILAFLVVSTSLCIARNTPKIIADWQRFNEGIRESGLKAFHHHATGEVPAAPPQAVADAQALLKANGWTTRLQERAGGTMIAARKGRLSKIGYIAAHSAIVLICLAGLFDGNLMIRLQMLLHGKSLYEGGGAISQVPPQHRLDVGNPTFRANLFVPEHARAGTAVISMPRGIILQELPFDVELKRFVVDYYDTGMPKLFASDVIFHDHATGKATPATIKVNEPAEHMGLTIYQSSFDDGGSLVTLKGLPLAAGVAPFTVKGRVGDELAISNSQGEALKVELAELKTINVENMGDAGSGTDVRKVDLKGTLDAHLGSGARREGQGKQMRNVGPAVRYKLVDASGQRREFHHYMAPITLEGRSIFLFGVREAVAEPFRYLRIPADENALMDGWLRLRSALLDAALRERAAAAYAKLATPEGSAPQMREQLQATAARALGLFAGAERVAPPAAASAAASAASAAEASAGLLAFSHFIEANVPEADRERMAQVLLRVLEGSLVQLNDLARAEAKLAPLEMNPSGQAFIQQSMLAMSDSFFYPAPFLLQLDAFDQVQASVFQVTKAPGKTAVYLGAVLLIVGVFAMLYLRDRRLWLWVTPAAGGASALTLALATPRRTLDTDTEFERLKAALWSAAP